jgi:signal transduction histidine kinase
MAGRVLRPVHAITSAARRLSQENLHERLRLDGPADELKELSDTFDSMLDRLDRAFQGQRSFIANASHELRTPLAVIRTEVDVGIADPTASKAEIQRSADVVRDAVSQSERLIDAFLALARSEGVVAREFVDLLSIAKRADAQLAGKAAERMVALRFAGRPTFVLGDPALLYRLIQNLIDNAIQHNVDGGWVDVTVRQSDEDAEIAVENGGNVVRPSDADRLFTPFVRLRPSSGPDRGVGLGLAIVKAIAEAHRGTVEAHARAAGGLTVTVRLPSVAAPIT